MGKLKLLNEPNGTLMYLIRHDRRGEHVDIQEVKYDGYKLYEESRYCQEEPGIRAFYYTQQVIDVKFRKGLEKSCYKCEYFDYWSGQRAFNTDEHLKCGGAEYPYIDFYFTTSKEKAVKYIKDNLFEDIINNKNNATEQFGKINSFIS